MSSSIQSPRFAGFRPALCLGVGVLVGTLTNSTFNLPQAARAEITEAPRREAFKDGGVLNEGVLREISATLKRMETRLEHIQKNTAPVPQPGMKK